MMVSAELAAAQTELMRRRKAQQSPPAPRPHTTWLSAASLTGLSEADNPTITQLPQHLAIAPDLAMAILRQAHSAPARIWHLLRLLDQNGRGWVEIAQARQQFCGTDSALRCIGWRQLRNILRAGNGIFWQRDQTRVWLKSRVKVAQCLGVQRFSLPLVDLPIAKFTTGIGNYRAALYATFHAGRDNRPIARPT
ncbi:MAG TPA: hypothetical protein ENJ56_06485, partial [Anaerolineae bacterium]|nr:hypothetical protein [Anaerolineae bacterium]